jgi:hypothetical protein
LVVWYDASEKVLADNGQYENGLCQRVYTMAVLSPLSLYLLYFSHNLL